ncbi:hypothetical protein [Pedobacter frigoris]|uniref:Uncharacterized protein n=1 Tax=Pedobacter frigoris TaxID=2571272 RepID=A0A4U1CHA8_9SPHI|nr:hypothetical protein [Pedobacter frigoris]TKC05967.1 hypothetical protein FA047_11545 [Pedobacter frigoris]
MNSRDDSASVHERFFDMGYLKYDASTGVFITQENNQLHPLHNINCSEIPENIRLAVENYLSQIISLSAK